MAGDSPGPANFWLPWSDILADTYSHHAMTVLGEVRFQLVTRALLDHLDGQVARVADIGGGYGRQAVLLAREGHEVVVIDPDAEMLVTATAAIAKEPGAVQDRITLVTGYGETISPAVVGQFDLVCCHSVLMYLPDPAPMLASLVKLARIGGLISILSLNEEALAMRSGLQGHWRQSLASILGRPWTDGNPVRADNVQDLTERLAELGVRSLGWHGVRVFSDHLDDTQVEGDFADLCALEWAAGWRDPYRRVARLFHLIGERHE